MDYLRLRFGRRLALALLFGLSVWLLAGWSSPVRANDQPLVPLTSEDGVVVFGSGPGADLEPDCGRDGDYFLLILPPWNRGLTAPGQDCDTINLEDELGSQAKTRIIIANVISIMTRLAGLVAVIAAIIAGFKYILSDGNSQKASGALKSIIHALSGLAVAIAATVIVEAVFRRLTGSASDVGLPQVDDISITDTIGFVMLLVGLIAILMIVLQGMRYALSQGNPDKTAQAKRGIIYSLVGALVAFSSWSLVQFVLGRVVLEPDSSPSGGIGALLGSIIGIIVFIVGVVSTIMVIVGGYKYIFSQGSSDKIGQARTTIIYALVGLVVAIFAGPILAWALGRI